MADEQCNSLQAVWFSTMDSSKMQQRQSTSFPDLHKHNINLPSILYTIMWISCFQQPRLTGACWRILAYSVSPHALTWNDLNTDYNVHFSATVRQVLMEVFLFPLRYRPCNGLTFIVIWYPATMTKCMANMPSNNDFIWGCIIPTQL